MLAMSAGSFCLDAAPYWTLLSPYGAPLADSTVLLSPGRLPPTPAHRVRRSSPWV